MKKLGSVLLAVLWIGLSLVSCRQTPPPSDSTEEVTVSASDPTSEATGTPQPGIEVTPDGNYIAGNYQTVSGKTVQSYPRLTNLPALYITLDEGREVSDIPHGSYVGGSYTFVSDYVEESYYEQPLRIKGRGNYSWSFYQKPYSLKLDEKADFLGMGAAKKWVLVTVSSDRTMLRNFMTQKFARELGLPGTCDNEFVDVIVNGSYHGTYVLTEKIEVGEHRVDIPKESGILFEIEMVYRHSCSNCVVLHENRRSPDNSVHLELKYYCGADFEHWDKTTRQRSLSRLQNYFDTIADAMQNDKYDVLQRYLDIDSFVNWYLLNEITRNYDSAFVTSCYCFIDENRVLHMGPCWDYDTCYGAQFGESQGQHIQDAPWFGWLFENCPEFVEATKARWTELRTNGAIDKFLSDIDVNRKTIEMSELMEHAKYPESEVHSYDSYEDAIAFLKSWLDERLVWMDRTFLIR